jgi:putative addiction module antidote
MHALKIRQNGNSDSITLPKEVLERLKVGRGDTIYLTEAPDGYRLTPYKPGFAEKMAAFEKVMREDRDLLKALGDA